jgi:prepilin peptidase CpaA
MRLFLAGLLAVACFADSRARRIPNWISVSGLAAGVIWHSFWPGGDGAFSAARPGGLGFLASAAGAAGAFAAFFLLYLLRAMGAGDVKLMGMLGAWFGVGSVPALVLAVLVAGGALAVLRAIVAGRLGRVLSNLRILLLASASRLSGRPGPAFDPGSDTADRLPYAWAIAGGAVALAVMQYLG